MFSEIATAAERAWLIVLLIAWAALLFGGLLCKPQFDRAGRMPMQTCILSSAVLVVAGWSWALVSRGTATAGYATWIATGMTLGFLGDALMARLLPLREHVLGGMGAFGLGHLAYITAGLRFGRIHGPTAPDPLWGAWAVWLLLGAIGWYIAVIRGQRPTPLHWAALPYALLLASTAGVATGLALQVPVFLPFAAGAFLFLVSDLILAAGLFGGQRHARHDDIIWLTYGPGQMLIVYSVGPVLGLVG